jgi:hypothetical protein
MFVLYAMVQKYFLKKSGKIYVCFVDFQKAFDRVDRTMLWGVLRKNGIGGKMLKILQSMYLNVKACVRESEKLTDFFDCPLGVRQGCVLSPTLFSFLINELALEVNQNAAYGIQLSPDIVQILILLFADDVTLSSYCAFGLQKQINCLKSFADHFGMTVNLKKTKIIVFRKGGFLAANEVWHYGGENIEVVNSYKYLGLHFTTKLSLTSSVTELAAKAKMRTIQILRCLWKLGNVQREVFFRMFDAQVAPVLMYGAEIWGFQQYGSLEKTHLFACKRLLNVGLNTPNKMIYGDLGRYPMHITAAVRCIKYWLRVICLPDERLPKKAYNMLYYLESLGKKSWAFYVKELLFRNGFREVWLQHGVGRTNVFISEFRQRLIDQFSQDWSSAVTSSERYEFYASFKRCLGAEVYFDVPQLRCFRDALIKFRLGISPIRAHKLRYRKDVLPRHLVCPLCKSAEEDEKHVLFHCRAYDDLRRDVIVLSPAAENNYVSVLKVMSVQDAETTIQLSRFLYRVYQKRTESSDE